MSTNKLPDAAPISALDEYVAAALRPDRRPDPQPSGVRGPLVPPRGRRVFTEVRARVEAIHERFDKLGVLTVPLDGPDPYLADAGTRVDVRDALARQGVADRWAEDEACRLAMWAPDPSPTVRAAFGAERVVVNAMPAASTFATAPATTFTAESVADIASLGSMSPAVARAARGGGVLDASWRSSAAGWAMDAVRPPAEAILAVADALDPATTEQVLAVDLGHDASHHVLSSLLPMATIMSCGTVYRSTPAPPPPVPAKGESYDAVVVNLPMEPTRRWSQVVGDNTLDPGVRHKELRKVRRQGARPVSAHKGIHEVIGPILPVLKPGVVLALLGDAASGRHGAALKYLRAQGVVLVRHGQIDGDRRALLVRYKTRPWSPMSVPPVTERLVSTWKVTGRSKRSDYDAHDLMNAAWSTTGGDPTMPRLGHHNGKPDRVDSVGMTKAEVYDAALRRDVAFFKKLARKVRRDRDWLVSIRSYRPKKPGPGERPIDDPSEIKRLVATLMARDLAELADLHDALPGTVIGYRRIYDVGWWTPTDGATIQDQFAGGVFASMKDENGVVSKTWLAKIDLKDAFGNLPHKAIHATLKALGLSQPERRRLIDIARINTYCQRKKKVIRVPGKGVEQGNPMSSLLLNLVLAFVFEKMKAVGVEAGTASYGDDVILVAGSENEARKAFDVFEKVSQDLGFENVRGLDDTKKPTVITNVAEKPVTLIRTYVITKDGIGLVDEKLGALRKAIGGRRLTPQAIRKLAGAMAISKKWLLAMGLYTPTYKVSPPDPPAGSDSKTPLDSLGRSRGAAGREDSTDGLIADGEQIHGGAAAVGDAGLGRDPVPVGEGSKGASRPIPSGHGADDATLAGSLDEGGRDQVLREPSALAGGDRNRDAVLPPREDEQDGRTPGGIRRRSSSLDDEPIVLSVLTQETPPPETGTTLESGSTGGSRDGRAGTLSSGPVQGSAGGRSGAKSSSLPSRSVRFDAPELEPALVGRNVRPGQRLKGFVLDLRGLGERLVGLDDEQAAKLVGRLLKAVRVMSVSRVLVHPGEPWVDVPSVLGGEQDGTYRRASTQHVDGGVLLRVVLRRRHGRRRRPSPHQAGARAWRLDSGRWRVRTEGRTVTVEVESPVMAIARMEALARAGSLLGLDLVPDHGRSVRHVGLARSSYAAST